MYLYVCRVVVRAVPRHVIVTEIMLGYMDVYLAKVSQTPGIQIHLFFITKVPDHEVLL